MRKICLVTLVTLVACGHEQPKYHPVAVDAAYLEAFHKLSHSMNAKLGYAILDIREGGSGSIVVDTLAIAEYSERIMPCLAYTENGVVYLPPSILSKGAWVMASYVLTHEIGHALGLEHSQQGIMQAKMQAYECIGHEAECLVEALREQGLAP